ncbi:MAG: DUF3054 domain-containing protein [Actinomycetota bacterium]
MPRCKLQLLDAVAVVAFVVIGRRSHDEADTLTGVINTAAPFLIGLVAAWFLLASWRHPAAVVVGPAVAALTATFGLVLRRFVFDEGTATSFVVVTVVFLTATMTGWRVVARVLDRRAVTA